MDLLSLYIKDFFVDRLKFLTKVTFSGNYKNIFSYFYKNGLGYKILFLVNLRFYG